MSERRVVHRKPSEGRVAGVCAGLADYFKLDVTLVRLGFVFLTLATNGLGLAVYVVLVFVLPVEGEDKPASVDGEAMGEHIQKFSIDMEDNNSSERLRNYFGVGLVVFGIWLASSQIWPGWVVFRWGYIWPVLLIVVGLWALVGGRDKRSCEAY